MDSLKRASSAEATKVASLLRCRSNDFSFIYLSMFIGSGVLVVYSENENRFDGSMAGDDEYVLQRASICNKCIAKSIVDPTPAYLINACT